MLICHYFNYITFVRSSFRMILLSHLVISKEKNNSNQKKKTTKKKYKMKKDKKNYFNINDFI